MVVSAWLVMVVGEGLAEGEPVDSNEKTVTSYFSTNDLLKY